MPNHPAGGATTLPLYHCMCHCTGALEQVEAAHATIAVEDPRLDAWLKVQMCNSYCGA